MTTQSFPPIPPGNSSLQVANNQPSALRLNLSRIAPVEPCLYTGSRDDDFIRIHRVDETTQRTINTAYTALKQLVAPAATEFTLSFEHMTAVCLENGRTEIKDLQDPVLQQYVEELRGVFRRVFPDREFPVFQPGHKSVSTIHPMDASHPVIQKIQEKNPDYSTCANFALAIYSSTIDGTDVNKKTAKQDAAIRRITAIECYLAPQLKLISPILDSKNRELETKRRARDQEADERRRLEITEDINKIQKQVSVLQTILNFDRLGLYVAAAFANVDATLSPYEQLQAATRAATAAQTALQEHIHKAHCDWSEENVARPWVPKFAPDVMRGVPTDIPENKEYSVDSAALIFSALPLHLSRKGALEFWREQKTEAKADCFQDGLLRLISLPGARIPLLDKFVHCIQTIDPAAAQNMRNAAQQSATKATNILAGHHTAFATNTTNKEKIDALKAEFNF